MLDTLIIGGGPAGLALSYHLGRRGLAHQILEAGRVGESWRSRRWDSLRLVAPNWHLRLPGAAYAGPDPDGFMGRDEVVAFIEAYARQIGAPVREGVRVAQLRARPEGPGFLAETGAGPLAARRVVVASGAYSAPRTPALGAAISGRVAQLHSMEYRRPEQLPPGGVLVVGAGESGCQIAEELARAGRTVWLAVGRCGWLPRRYRGRDSVAWLAELGAFEQAVESLPCGHARCAPPGPQLTGLGAPRDLNLHTLAGAGVRLLGRLVGADGERLRFAPDLRESLERADAGAAGFCAAVDALVASHGLDAPPAARVAYAAGYAAAAAAPAELDLAGAGVAAVVWASGYRPDYGWISLPACDADGFPLHRRGVSPLPGLYFLGLEWQSRAGSHVFQGLGDDAAYIAEALDAERSGGCLPTER